MWSDSCAVIVMRSDLKALEQAPPLSSSSPTNWQRWVATSVHQLQQSHLLRTLHPVSTTDSPVEVSTNTHVVFRCSTPWHQLMACVGKVELSHHIVQEWLDSITDTCGNERLQAQVCETCLWRSHTSKFQGTIMHLPQPQQPTC